MRIENIRKHLILKGFKRGKSGWFTYVADLCNIQKILKNAKNCSLWYLRDKLYLVKDSSGTKLFFWGGPTIFAPSDIVVQGHFQVVSVILAPSKSNLCAFLIAVSFLRGGAWLSLVSFLDPLLQVTKGICINHHFQKDTI